MFMVPLGMSMIRAVTFMAVTYTAMSYYNQQLVLWFTIIRCGGQCFTAVDVLVGFMFIVPLEMSMIHAVMFMAVTYTEIPY